METGARRVRTFRGRTMDEALDLVREEMGPEAVILQARNLRSRSWWGFRGSGVEVVAGVPAEADQSRSIDRVQPSVQRPALEREVEELRWLVDHMMNRASDDQENDTRATATLRGKLVQQAIPETLARRLVESAVVEAGGARDDDLKVHDALVSVMARMLPTAGPPRIRSSRTTRIALVGPTGVGKTTTIAKLAAHLALKERRSCGFLAADTYRIAAVDQLKRYAQLMSAPMRIARTAEDVSRAAAALSSCEIVFMDTAGRSPRDSARMEELRTFLRAARSDEVHLVLSLASDTKALFTAIDRFRPLGVTRLILTKADETERAGGILQAVARAGLPVSHVTTGQGVPDDIALADSRDLARAVIDGPQVLLRGIAAHAAGYVRRAA
jgi:flagellar biosynthesis protein FlhF